MHENEEKNESTNGTPQAVRAMPPATIRSMYMQRKTGAFDGSFCKNTVYRFLNSTKTNWQRFYDFAFRKNCQ